MTSPQNDIENIFLENTSKVGAMYRCNQMQLWVSGEDAAAWILLVFYKIKHQAVK